MCFICSIITVFVSVFGLTPVFVARYRSTNSPTVMFFPAGRASASSLLSFAHYGFPIFPNVNLHKPPCRIPIIKQCPSVPKYLPYRVCILWIIIICHSYAGCLLHPAEPVQKSPLSPAQILHRRQPCIPCPSGYPENRGKPLPQD